MDAAAKPKDAGPTQMVAGTPLVKVWVSRFLKHPSGHTVFETCVEVPATRQVWAVYKRYRDFVALRQQLKGAHQRQPQQQPNTPRSARGQAKTGGRSDAAVAAGRGATPSGRVSRSSSSNSSSAALSAERIKPVLLKHKFPSKLSFGGSVALRQERKVALHQFLRALVKVRPLPECVAIFLGLLDDNRMSIDRNGEYVPVLHAGNISPMPESPRRSRAQAAKWRMADPHGGSGGGGSDAAPDGTAVGARGRAESNAIAGETVAAPPSVPDGIARDTDSEPQLRWDLLPPAVDSATPVRGGYSTAKVSRQQPSIGSRAWSGVRNAERPLSLRGAEQSWSDTEDPTDSESGSESDSGFGDDGISVLDAVAGRSTASAAGEGFPRAAAGGVGSRLVNRSSPVAYSSERQSSRGDGTPAASALGKSFPRTSAPPSVARLRGGGGGTDSDEGEDGDDIGKGWSVIASDSGGSIFEAVDGLRQGDEAAQAAEAVAASEEAAAVVHKEQEERTVQKKFVDGYLDEVVSRVVSRRDIADGMGGIIGGSWNLTDETSGVLGASSARSSRNDCLPPEERDIRMAELQSLGVDLPNATLLTLLRYKDWGPEAATALYQDLVAAGKGLLEKVIPGGIIRGLENGGNTCYIDSLLFAMFSTLEAFDWLLLKPLPQTDPPEVKLLQKHLRFLVNQLRRGAVIHREHTNLIRTHLRACGWHGGSSSQEDVSELFTFLVCLLRCPALPLSEALFHGGKTDASDSRISTERALYLALPDEKEADPLPPPKKKDLSPTRGDSLRQRSPTPSPTAPSRAFQPFTARKPDSAGAASAGGAVRSDVAAAGGSVGSAAVTLEHILMHNFHDNRVEGLRRSVSGEKGIQPVDAWRMVSVLPFYALSGEHAGDADPSNDRHFDKIMLPMVLKRYETDDSGAASMLAPGGGGAAAVKSRRKVVVPHRLDCSKFMAPEGSASEAGRFVLVLRSAVCHLGGESVSKGHYVAYTDDRGTIGGDNDDTGRRGGAGKSTGTGSRLPPARGASDCGKGVAEPAAGLPRTGSGARGREGHDSVAWLRLDDLKKSPSGRGFVERLDSVHDANVLFSEHLSLHSYMLFYELVPLNLDDADKAQIREKCALIETQSDYELALQVELSERAAAAGARGASGAGSNPGVCHVS